MSQVIGNDETFIDPLVGTVLGKEYSILKRIGAGGMGVVYEVEHQKLGKQFAAKVLSAELAANREARIRFSEEALAVSQLDHENVVNVSDVGMTADNRPFIIMELLRGEPLDQRLQRGKVSFEESVAIITMICHGVEAAHAAGIVHRDLKPENIFITRRSGNRWGVKVLDFGIARTTGDQGRITKMGQALGSPAYMAPEACRGQSTDSRVDIYAIGIIAYQLLCGRLPFADANALAIMQMQILEEVPPMLALNPSLPPKVVNCVMRLLEKDPLVRTQTIEEFLTAFEAALPLGADQALIDARRGNHGRSSLVMSAVQADGTPNRASTSPGTEEGDARNKGRGLALPLQAPARTPMSSPAITPASGRHIGALTPTFDRKTPSKVISRRPLDTSLGSDTNRAAVNPLTPTPLFTPPVGTANSAQARVAAAEAQSTAVAAAAAAITPSIPAARELDAPERAAVPDPAATTAAATTAIATNAIPPETVARERKSNTKWVAIAGLLVAAAALLFFLQMQKGKSDTTAPTTKTEVIEPNGLQPQPVPSPPTPVGSAGSAATGEKPVNVDRAAHTVPSSPAQITLKVDSTPTGATVMLGDVIVGETPLETKVDQQPQGDLKLSLGGFESTTKTISLDKDAVVAISLSPIMPPGTQPGANAVKRPGSTTQKTVKPKDSKDPKDPKTMVQPGAGSGSAKVSPGLEIRDER